MRMDARWAIAALVLAALAATVRLMPGAVGSTAPPQRPAPTPLPASTAAALGMAPTFYDAAAFARGLAAAEAAPAAEVGAVLVPHHLLASELIGTGLGAARRRAVGTVVIVGPNHEEIGPSVLTTDSAWETPVGRVDGARELALGLTEARLASANTAVFRTEHSVGALVPFVRALWPEARVLPLLLRHDTLDETPALARWLAAHLPEDALVVYSVDFSHYRPAPEAARFDAASSAWLAAGDAAALAGRGSDYFDSPGTLALALQLAAARGWRMEEWRHASSVDFGGAPAGGVTGYFVCGWRAETP
jgi:AmmeMemoRadiSam system protein B